jgi:hypothetical protein
VLVLELELELMLEFELAEGVEESSSATPGRVRTEMAGSVDGGDAQARGSRGHSPAMAGMSAVEVEGSCSEQQR